MNEKELELIKRIKYEAICLMYSCKESRNIIFSDQNNKEIKCLAKLVVAQGHLSCIKSIYFTSIDDKRESIDKFIYQSDTFIDEITNNIATDHSHQWTDIEYLKLAEIYDYSVLSDTTFFSE